MPILAIETSCDETAVAIYCPQTRALLANQVYSQTEIHAPYGGVVPELASRDHIRKLLPLLRQTLDEAGLRPDQLHGIAYTRGPGLIGALMVGATVARSLAYAWGLPALGVHHLEAHLQAVMLEEDCPQYPFLSLLVSGGHTMLVQVNAFGDYELLGETVDDAAGEAFDKTAKRLGLPYPGGPALAKLAEQGDPERFHFPRPMLGQPNCDFSFSGLKTHSAECWLKNQTACPEVNKQLAADIAVAFEVAVVDVLLRKTKRALAKTGDKRLVVAGGVSANQRLRRVFAQELGDDGVSVYYPRVQFCTDNAAMVAITGATRLAAGEKDCGGIDVQTRWPLADLIIKG